MSIYVLVDFATRSWDPPPNARRPSTGSAAIRPRLSERQRLPVDGYGADLALVVEFQEEQHSQPSPFFDR